MTIPRKKILLFGSQGMLGMDFLYGYEDEFEIIPLSRFHFDLEDTKRIIPEITKYAPHAIVNASAWTEVDKAENPRFQDSVRRVNIDAAGEMAKSSESLGIPFIHISTDYVFSGTEKSESFGESSKKHPLNFYGKTKSEGEDAALAGSKNTYILRTAWLYGEYGPNFVARMIHLSRKHEEVRVVDDQFGNPTWTRPVADTIALLIRDSGKEYSPGIYHAVSEIGDTPPSWFDFASKIYEFLEIKREIVPVKAVEFVSPSKRPASSVLMNTKLPPLPRWEEMLRSFLSLSHKPQ